MGDDTQVQAILDHIQSIQAQRTELENLQRDLTTEENLLIERLRTLRIGTAPRTRPARPVHQPPPRDTPRPFILGDRVRIRNPTTGQPIRGTVTRIGHLISVTAPSGERVNRAPHNLILEVPARNHT